jgi:para-nitrobenzyl esterase
LELTSFQVPTFGYEFNDEQAPMAFLPPVTFPYGAAHTDELQFLFPFGTNMTAGEQKLATTMKDYWTIFAANGDPNLASRPFWPRFSIFVNDDQSLKPAEPNVEFNFARAHKCNFWTTVLLQTSLPEIVDQIRSRDVIRQ